MNEYLQRAYAYWSAAAEFRRRRTRFKNYTYGKQWSDPVADSEGRILSEGELARSHGHNPVTNNLIRQLVKTVVGRYRTRASEQQLYTTPAIREIARRNSLAELDARLLEEFLISGCAVQRISYERRFDGTAVWIDNVNPARIFVNPYSDPRGADIDFIGQLHDMSWPEIVNRFAGGSRRKAEEIRSCFEKDAGLWMTQTGGFAETAACIDFHSPAEPSEFRVIEVWSFDARESSLERPLTMNFCWHCRWFAPDGTLLRETDSPFPHRHHPFVLKFYPMTDGEVHPFVEDVIEQQRCVNRMVTLIDHMLATSAKRVLLYPADQLPQGMTFDDVARRWAQTDGILPITGRGSTLPSQVVTNTAQSGAHQLLQLQLKLFQDVSGVGDALLGRSDLAANGARMLDAQIANATAALADTFDTFLSFTEIRNSKARMTRF